MNVILKELGYVEGDPGAYGVTEKGAKYAFEKDHHRGPGGYSWYNRDWTTRTWDNGTGFWRVDVPGRPAGNYGPLNAIARNKVNLDRIVTHWPDMLRVAGSLVTNQVRAYDLLRMLTRDGYPTPLGQALAEYGRIAKTLHLLAMVDPVDETYRRTVTRQLNIGEGRHSLARKIFHGHAATSCRRTGPGRKTNSARSGSYSTRWCCSTPATSTWPPTRYAVRATRCATRTPHASPRSGTRTSTCWAATPSRPRLPSSGCALCATRMQRPVDGGPGLR